MLNTQRVEQRRKQLGLTMEQAASLAGLPGKSYWHDIIAGRRANVTLSTLDQIAAALRLDPRELITTPRRGRTK